MYTRHIQRNPESVLGKAPDPQYWLAVNFLSLEKRAADQGRRPQEGGEESRDRQSIQVLLIDYISVQDKVR